jgi:Cdc6-like AAA superfamily ATPase
MNGSVFGGHPSLIEYDLVVAQLATRAEDLTDLYGTFVETIYPEKMQARANQIINGRRGAGKTHLLRRVEGRLRASFPETKILPVYVNGSDLSQEINGLFEVSREPVVG